MGGGGMSMGGGMPGMTPDGGMGSPSNIKIKKIKSGNVWSVLEKLLSNTDGQSKDSSL
jgi:hypothetical protein